MQLKECFHRDQYTRHIDYQQYDSYECSMYLDHSALFRIKQPTFIPFVNV